MFHILVPTDNSVLAAANLERAEKARREGESFMLISASRGNNPEHYTNFTIVPSFEQAESAHNR